MTGKKACIYAGFGGFRNYSHPIPETVTLTILYRLLGSDYRDCLDYPRITVYHNSCCHCVVRQRDYLVVKLLLYSSPQAHMESRMGFRLLPSSVSEYSTLGGTSA